MLGFSTGFLGLPLPHPSDSFDISGVMELDSEFMDSTSDRFEELAGITRVAGVSGVPGVMFCVFSLRLQDEDIGVVKSKPFGCRPGEGVTGVPGGIGGTTFGAGGKDSGFFCSKFVILSFDCLQFNYIF